MFDNPFKLFKTQHDNKLQFINFDVIHRVTNLFRHNLGVNSIHFQHIYSYFRSRCVYLYVDRYLLVILKLTDSIQVKT